MSTPIAPDEPRLNLKMSRRAIASCWVWIAGLLSLFPPRIIICALKSLRIGATKPEVSDVTRWRSEVNSVSTRCRGDGCLQRSLAVMLLARSDGALPDWRVGVRATPFLAHAWVELDGVPIGENTSLDEFRTLLFVKGHQTHRPSASAHQRSEKGLERMELEK